MSTAVAAKTARVSIDGLRAGARLQSPIQDDKTSVLLVAAGVILTDAMIEKIRSRGITYVRVAVSDLARLTKGDGEQVSGASAVREPLRRPAREVAEKLKDQSRKGKWNAGSKAFIQEVKRPRNVEQQKYRIPELSQKFSTTQVEIKGAFVTLSQGGKLDAGVLERISTDALKDMAEDMDLFLLLGMNRDDEQYPFSHSLQTARIATAMGASLGMDEASLTDLAIGCMIHDVGMLKVNPDLLNIERPLDKVERLDITKHPIFAFDLIAQIPQISVGARMVAYQMHERLDGSGYPRQRLAFQIHPLALIAMVADTFVAMTSARPHRPPIQPYYALVELLEAVKARQFDPAAVKALISVVGLFPVGSYVELSDKRIGKVLSANSEQFARPMVEAWFAQTPEAKEVVDLAKTEDVTIVRPHVMA